MAAPLARHQFPSDVNSSFSFLLSGNSCAVKSTTVDFVIFVTSTPAAGTASALRCSPRSDGEADAHLDRCGVDVSTARHASPTAAIGS